MNTDNRVETGLDSKRITRDWDAFDALPREYKELLWNAHSGTICILASEGGTPAMAKAILTEAQAKACRAAYGPTHPQAKRDAVEDSLFDLGLL